MFQNGELNFYPKPPKYRKPGLFPLTYPNKWRSLTEEGIRCPKGRKVKAWDAKGVPFGVNLESFFIPIPTNLNWEGIKEGRQRRLQRIRILPRNSCFYAEFVYGVESQPADVDLGLALGIDHGVDNWLTCVDIQGGNFIIDGRHLKSINQWYNKRVATLKENQPQEHGKNSYLAPPAGAIARCEMQ